MADKLAGKIAIITGGGRGIGAGITQRFVEEGAKVAIVQTNAPPELMLNERAIYVKADLSSSQEISSAVQAVVERLGGLDILVNNAGIMFEKRYHRGGLGPDDGHQSEGPIPADQGGNATPPEVGEGKHCQHRFNRRAGVQSRASCLRRFESGHSRLHGGGRRGPWA